MHFLTIRGRGPIHDILEEKCVKTYALNAINAKDYIKCILKLNKILKQGKFDIVHSNESIPAAISGIACKFSLKAAHVFQRHHNQSAQKSNLFNFIALKTADFVICVSKSTIKFTTELDNYPKERVFLAYNGIAKLPRSDEKYLGQLRDDLGINKESKIITIVGKLREEKGHITLFEAAELIAKYMEAELHIIIVGDGYYLDTLLLKADKIDNVKFHFVGSKDDIWNWFSLADVAAIPSYSEPFGLVSVEAMNCRVPIVASDVDGLKEIFQDSEAAVLVKPRSVEELAEGIQSIFNSSKLRNKLVANGEHLFNSRFTIAHMVESWIATYESIINEDDKH